MTQASRSGGAAASVAIVQEWVPAYRVSFFDDLRAELTTRGIELRLLHGQPPADRKQRNDASSLSWAEVINNRSLRLAGREVTWQPVLRELRSVDLVVVPQAVTLPVGTVATLLASLPFGGFPPVAVWGHGENIETTESVALAERYKRWLTRRAAWFFAYTSFSADLVASSGFPADRISTVNNTRDPAVVAAGEVSGEVQALLERVDSRTSNVGWMISALDGSKKLGMLIEALDTVKASVPDFEFFVVGAGSHEQHVRDAASMRPWLHVTGARFGADRSAIGSRAKLTVHPGLIGLHVIDSFGFGAPIVTAQMADHSHEVTYLQDGVNARVLDEGATGPELGRAAAALLNNEAVLAELREGCAVSAESYGLASMVRRFADGVEHALVAS